MFSVKVKIVSDADPVEITWSNGVLYGDAFATRLVELHAHSLEGEAVGPPTGPFTYHNHLESPVSAALLIRRSFDERVSDWSGDLPTLPPLPEGAVA